MLRESEPYRRNARDDAEASRARWERYEAEKQRIAAMNLDANDYARLVRAAARELGI